MRSETIFARLVDEPFCLDIQQIRKLTIHQLQAIYFHERDKNGVIVPRHDGEPDDDEDAGGDQHGLLKKWKQHGLSRAEIAIKWREYQDEQALWGQLDAEGLNEEDKWRRIKQHRLGVMSRRATGYRPGV